MGIAAICAWCWLLDRIGSVAGQLTRHSRGCLGPLHALVTGIRTLVLTICEAGSAMVDLVDRISVVLPIL